MAEIRPFRALHYNQGCISALDKVITQPYDKISPEMQARYYELSPYNLVRIIRGRQAAADAGQESLYTRAQLDFRDWIEHRILISESEPAIYPYYQQFQVPGKPGVTKVRRGFIGLVRLEDYAARVVHRQEETLSGPERELPEVLKPTPAAFAQRCAYSQDPSGNTQ